MRVFELLTALCVYSTDGYELVLEALKNLQVENRVDANRCCRMYLIHAHY
jgi:hypothetical protein